MASLGFAFLVSFFISIAFPILLRTLFINPYWSPEEAVLLPQDKRNKRGARLAFVVLVIAGSCSFTELSLEAGGDGVSLFCRVASYLLCLVVNLFALRRYSAIEEWISENRPKAEEVSLLYGFVLALFALNSPPSTLFGALTSMVFMLWMRLIEVTFNLRAKSYLSIVATLISIAFLAGLPSTRSGPIGTICSFLPMVFLFFLWKFNRW